MLRALPIFATLAAATLRLAAQGAVPFGEILPGVPCERTFTAARDGLQGIAVPIATWGRTNTCTLQAELFAADTLLARAEWPTATLVDNAEIELPCPVQPTSRGATFRLVLQSPDATPGNAVTTWVDAATGLRVRPSFAGDTLLLGEIAANTRIVQTFVATQDGLCGVQALFTDFGRRNAGTVHLSLRDPIAGTELAAKTIDAATIGNEDWRGVEFAPVADSAGRTFALALTAPEGAPGAAVTAYLDPGAPYRGDLSKNGAPRLGRLMLTTSHAATGLSLAGIAGYGCVGLAGLCAVLGLRARRHRGKARRTFAAAVAAGAAPVVGLAYAANCGWVFWPMGFVACLALLVVTAGARRRRVLWLQIAMVPLLLFTILLGLQPFGAARPVAAAGATTTNAHSTAADALDLRSAPWSFERSQGDPEAFRRWWQRLTGEWNAPDRGCALVQRPDPLGELPFVLQPNTSTRFFDSTIRVNNLGCRGPDVARDKQGAFRIVCLGESTTMGQTIFAADRPWPEVLQDLLTDPPRARRVEVINAGWASYDVRHSAVRLRRFVLDLEPDLIVVYHGYNGFWMLLPDIPPALVTGGRLPRHEPRPSWLLANAEYGLRLAAFRRAMTGAAGDTPPNIATSACARAYRELIGDCARRGIGVVLCSFNMAVRADSPSEVVEFYRTGFPRVERQIAANNLQTALLRQIAAAERGVTFIDTSTDLDGAFGDAFVDLVHFTQAGRDRLARNVAAGIRPLLPK